MAKRTWITVKRGILEPKHRFALGELIWLYMFILDITNWEAGTIEEWSDRGTAEEMDMPLATLVDQRRKLQEKGYITCERKQHGIRVIVHNWTNPREYSGKKYNEKIPVNTPSDTLVNTPINTPINTPEIKTTATFYLPSFNQKSQIKRQKEDIDDISIFMEISGIAHRPKMLADISSWNKTLAFLRDSGVTDEIMRTACKNIVSSGGEITSPESIISECGKLLRRGENMETIKNHDKRFDPPAIPEYAECAKCGEKFHADDLDDNWLCNDCLQLAEEQERE